MLHLMTPKTAKNLREAFALPAQELAEALAIPSGSRPVATTPAPSATGNFLSGPGAVRPVGPAISWVPSARGPAPTSSG
jgi:hypothetical protein